MTNAQITLTREARNALRAAVTAASGWHNWRAVNLADADGTIRDASTMKRAELLAAAEALGIDALAIVGASVSDAAPAAPLDAAPAAPLDVSGKSADALIREALAPAEGMVGPKLLDMLAASVAPLAAAAAAGPKIVEKIITKTVTVGNGSSDAMPARFCDVQSAATPRDLFGLKASDCGQWRAALETDISIWDGTGADGVPDIDPHHVWDAEALAYLSIASRYADENSPLRNMSRVLMFGPAGTGKTSSVAQFAALTRRPFVRIAFDRTTEPAELIGQRMPKAGGGTEFREGALVSAMQIPGCVILLDEPSFLRPGAAAVLQTLLDNGAIYLKEDGNRRVQLAHGVVICAADNTNLAGDETGRYCDTQTQNIALQDRFAWLVKCDYLPEGREASVLHARTGLHMDAARVMVTFANRTRQNAKSGQITAGVSLRRLVAWAVAVKAGVPSLQAFGAAVMSACDAADRETVQGLAKNLADHATIDAAAWGKPLPVRQDPATMTPAGAAAAETFAGA